MFESVKPKEQSQDAQVEQNDASYCTEGCYNIVV